MEGGTSGEHLGQAIAHIQQAAIVAFRAVWPCGMASGSAAEMVADAEVNGDKAGQHSNSKTEGGAAVRAPRIPKWTSQSEMYADKHQAQISGLGDEPYSHRTWKTQDQLEEHEYVLDDEFNNSKTTVICPKSKWKESWDIGVLMFILYSAVVVPFRICFSAEAEGNMWTLEVGISLFFIADVIMNFNTAYAVDDKWVISRPRIIGRYLAGWFWIDAPSSLPVELITAVMLDRRGGSHLSLLRFLRLFRLLRLLRLLKVDKYIAMLEDKFEVNLVSLRVLGMVIKLIFMVHMLGCFWFYVAVQAMEGGEEISWVLTYDGGRALEGCDDAEGCDVRRQYIYSIYWALTTLTTVGYGDIVPTNMPERLYCLFAMLMGAMMFGYMMSTIGSMVTTMDKQAALVEEKMDAVKEWMLSRNIPRPLVIRVRKYYEHYYTRKSAFDEEDIVRGLTPALRTEVTSLLLRDSLGHFPLLSLLGVEFQQEIYPRLKPVSYANMDVIYNRGDSSEDIYFLRKGLVDVLAGGVVSNVLYRVSQGQYFGEEALTHERRGCTVISNGWSELWSLSRDVFDEVVEKFPELASKMETFLVSELDRKSRLYALSYRVLINMAEGDPELRSALILQKAWTSFSASKARQESKFAKAGRPSRSFKRASTSMLAPARSATPEAMQAALVDIQAQLVNMKREMRNNGVLPSRSAQAVRPPVKNDVDA